MDNKENIYPRKERPENKIDGVVALITGLSRLLTVPDEEAAFNEFLRNPVAA